MATWRSRRLPSGAVDCAQVRGLLNDAGGGVHLRLDVRDVERDGRWGAVRPAKRGAAAAAGAADVDFVVQLRHRLRPRHQWVAGKRGSSRAVISFVNILTQDYDLTRPDEGYVRDADALPMNCLILVAILVSSRFGCPKKVGLRVPAAVHDVGSDGRRRDLAQDLLAAAVAATTADGEHARGGDLYLRLSVHVEAGAGPGLSRRGRLHTGSPRAATSPGRGIPTRCPETGRAPRRARLKSTDDDAGCVPGAVHVHHQGQVPLGKVRRAGAQGPRVGGENARGPVQSGVHAGRDHAQGVGQPEGRNTRRRVITALSTRVLRLKVNAFYESCYLLASIFEKFPSYV
ncbi:phosphatidylinositol glycan, putative [Babesia caballi]|uniref:Phosphatidylinositol glycan, putative n=1 Tax=Babesia caballi TaxID=5871 RepID=A0AAV4LRQ5_BABCB|nr:phosphatidylinositol glycan, putative [Babesia caballi]